MSFDNHKFTTWLVEFEKTLIECGMPERQAMRFRGEFYEASVAHYAGGLSPSDAAIREVMDI
jgi:hypothetical protein